MHDRKFPILSKDVLDSPDRTELYDLPRILGELDVREGAVVADVGAGTGFFAFPIAGIVGQSGKVLAIDISSEMLGFIEDRKRESKIENLETSLSTEEKIEQPDDLADLALIVTVLHELEGGGTLREIHRILKQDGKLAVIDWKKIEEERGPPFHHRLAVNDAISFCESAGFKLEKRFEATASHYGLIFRKLA